MTEAPTIPADRQEQYTPEWIDSISVASRVVLDSIVDVAESNGVVLPTRQIIYVSTVPKDCEQVAVSVGSYGFGRPGDPQPGPDPNGCWYPTVVTLTAEITRCVPENNQVRPMGRYATGMVELPSNTAMEEHAEVVMRDMMVLLESANVASNYPFPGSGTEASVIPADPQGGYQSVFLTLTLQV